jgi:hypothetical protein
VGAIRNKRARIEASSSMAEPICRIFEHAPYAFSITTSKISGSIRPRRATPAASRPMVTLPVSSALMTPHERGAGRLLQRHRSVIGSKVRVCSFMLRLILLSRQQIMLTELDEMTIANMTAALEVVCDKLPPDTGRGHA